MSYRWNRGADWITPHMSRDEQLERYRKNVGHEPPEPYATPDWLYSNRQLPAPEAKQWFIGFTGGAKPVKLSPKRKASLSPLEFVAKAKRERERANKTFQEAVRAAVTAGEGAGKVGDAAGITRQRVYQIAS